MAAAGAVVALALGAGLLRAEDARCGGREIADFADLADRLSNIAAIGAVTVLNVELVESRARPCRASWIVEVLTPEDTVVALIFDAHTLEERMVGSDTLLGLLDREAEEEPEIWPTQIVAVGGADNDFVEGDWTDDRLSGRGGRDLFVLTPGSDIVMDFDPAEDVLDVSPFVHGEYGVETLGSLRALAAASRPGRALDRPALVIDIDGAANDWATALIGVEIGDLNRGNVFFGLPPFEAPPLRLQTVARRVVTMSDESLIAIPAHLEDEPLPEPRLLRGSAEALDALLWIIEDRMNGADEDGDDEHDEHDEDPWKDRD